MSAQPIQDILDERRDVMKRHWIYKCLGMLLCSFLVIMAGAWAKEDNNLTEKENIPSSVKSYLKETGIKNFEVKKIPEPQKESKKVKITCTEKEIDDYIATDLENYDSLKNTKKKIVKKGDFIRL